MNYLFQRNSYDVMLCCPLRFPNDTMFGSSLPPTICRSAYGGCVIRDRNCLPSLITWVHPMFFLVGSMLLIFFYVSVLCLSRVLCTLCCLFHQIVDSREKLVLILFIMFLFTYRIESCSDSYPNCFSSIRWLLIFF